MKLSVREGGRPDGPPIVLLHAFPLSSEMWRPQFEALGAWRVLAPDFRGFGGTPLAAPWLVEHAADDVLESVPKEPAVFLGLSMGGYVALRLAEKAPERVRALVLCDTRAEADSNENKLQRAAAIDAIRGRGAAAFLESFLKGALFPGAAPSAAELSREIAAKASPESLMAAFAALSARPDMTAFLPRVQVPSLLLFGAQDRVTPPALAESLRSRIPDAELHSIPDAGHFCNLENPAAFNEKLLSFLGRL